jgi:hypothetical protein
MLLLHSATDFCNNIHSLVNRTFIFNMTCFTTQHYCFDKAIVKTKPLHKSKTQKKNHTHWQINKLTTFFSGHNITACHWFFLLMKSPPPPPRPTHTHSLSYTVFSTQLTHTLTHTHTHTYTLTKPHSAQN